MTKMSAVILAAGRGTRMNSDIPKCLHQISHKPMLEYVIAAADQAGADEICLVIGHGRDEVRSAMGGQYKYALQTPQLGTGHALQQAMPIIAYDTDAAMVLCGDTPLIRKETLKNLRGFFEQSQAECTIMTSVLADGANYGRIVRNQEGNVEAIIEAADADEAQLAVREINSGVYCFQAHILREMLAKIKPNNQQGEYYLTDVIKEINAAGGKVNAYICEDSSEIAGVNDKIQLSAAAKILRQRKNAALMRSGVTMIDPDTVYIDDEVEIGVDCVIEPQVYIEGESKIGAGCHIGPLVKISASIIGDNCEIGPFCYLRPGTVLENKVKAGHFVEIKKSHIGYGSKVPHLSYIGDATIGEGVNIGCGTITCNYDGKNKYPTVIEDQAFVGSNTNFIAPVTIGKRATIAAGSTITADVPDDALAVARGRQTNIADWATTRDPRFVKKSGK